MVGKEGVDVRIGAGIEYRLDLIESEKALIVIVAFEKKKNDDVELVVVAVSYK